MLWFSGVKTEHVWMSICPWKLNRFFPSKFVPEFGRWFYASLSIICFPNPMLPSGCLKKAFSGQPTSPNFRKCSVEGVRPSKQLRLQGSNLCKFLGKSPLKFGGWGNKIGGFQGISGTNISDPQKDDSPMLCCDLIRAQHCPKSMTTSWQKSNFYRFCHFNLIPQTELALGGSYLPSL